ncbi:MAG: hypothetical protein Q8P67_24780, partial [archaeon]|nr:hypothetical protein [archaeon]
DALAKVKQLREGHFTDASMRSIYFHPSGRGTGSSTALQSLVVYARLNGWLVAYVPDACALTGARGDHFKIVKSATVEGCWDVPSAAAEFLAHQLAAHRALLETLPIKKSFTIGEGERAFDPKDRSLADLLDYGLESYDPEADDLGTVSTVLFHYRNELNRVTGCPVLIAVDSYNGFWNPSGWVDPTEISVKTFDDVRRVHQPMPASRISLTQLFLSAGSANPGLVNGLGAVALSRSDLKPKTLDDCLQANPHARQATFRIDPYTPEEFWEMYSHYFRLSLPELTPEDARGLPTLMPPSAVSYAYSMTSGYPAQLVEYRKKGFLLQ